MISIDRISMAFVAICLVNYATAIIPSTPKGQQTFSGSISINYTTANGVAPAGSLDIPMTQLSRSVVGVMPDQISIKYWGTGGAYLISWATGDGQVGPGVIPPVADSVATKVMVSTSPFVNDSSVISSVGISLTYLYDYSADVQNGTLDYDYLNGAGVATSPVNYASPILHHALVEGLKPSTTYYYRVGDPKFWGGLSQPASFVTLPEPSAKTTYPFRLAVIADIGQTYNTSSMMKRLMASQIDAVSIIGDFTYGDNYDSSGCMYYSFTGVTGHYIGADPSTGLPSFTTPAGNWCPFSGPEGDLSEQTYQAKWDTFMRLWQPVFSKFPVMFANGNHEIEELPTGARFTGLNARWPTPPPNNTYSTRFSGPKPFTRQAYLQTLVKGQIQDEDFDPMGAYHNMFYSVEVSGATMIYLTTFIGQDDFSTKSVQYQWFLATLQAVNRTRTPWIIVNFHYPMYSSYSGTYKGIDCFRATYEPLFLQFGVDLVFNGHVHAYERSHPVYAYQLNRCGPTHIIVGDGGNNEGVTKSFFDTSAASKKWCKPGNQTLRGFPEYQPQACFTLNPDGQYCDFSQPTWSAYRNPSWGFGVLTIFNETTAHWIWNNTDGLSTTANVVYDEVYFTRNSNSPSCPSGPRPAGRRLRMKKRV